MAVARVELCWDAERGEREAIINGVASALVDALHVPVGDPTVIAVTRRPHDVVFPAKVGVRYTIVTITMFAGRTTDTKRRLYEPVVQRLSDCGVPPTDVLIILDEVPIENWGVDGGIPATEVDVGFTIAE